MADYNMIIKLNKYHKESIKDKSFLITGGAGFIGSNIASYLISNEAKKVRVLDNLSNGIVENIEQLFQYQQFEFIEGDIADYDTCCKSVKGIEYISHQAALGSVPRSVKDPLGSNKANVTGFLNMLHASKESKTLKKFVYAASSSTYGDSMELPKVEGNEGRPLSPYAVTKLVNEIYAEVYSKVYGFNTIGLRYFNVFGPGQSHSNPYAAVIPIFCNCFINNNTPIINGDGLTSRDFTFITNAVQANIKALLNSNIPTHEVYNVACGEQTNLNEIITILSEISEKEVKPTYGPERLGDVKHSLADISKIVNDLDYKPDIYFKKGLELVYKWYLDNN